MPDRDARTTLSEADSKALLAGFGLPVLAERLAADADAAADRRRRARLPRGGQAVRRPHRPQDRAGPGATRPRRRRRPCAPPPPSCWLPPPPEDGEVSVLVAPMVQGNRELIAGLADDPQFGMTVMVGVGGILAEAVADVAIRLVPITRADARRHDRRARARNALLGPFRGEPAVDRDAAGRRAGRAVATPRRRRPTSCPPTSTRSSSSTACPSPSTPWSRCVA